MSKHKLIKSHHLHKEIHGSHVFGRFNGWLAVWVTKNVGTMWCAYLFAVLGITGIVAALTQNTMLVLLVGAVSGYFLQLVLLPVIIVGQNIAQASSDARAETDHETLNTIHELTENINKLQETQMEILKKIG